MQRFPPRFWPGKGRVEAGKRDRHFLRLDSTAFRRLSSDSIDMR